MDALHIAIKDCRGKMLWGLRNSPMVLTTAIRTDFKRHSKLNFESKIIPKLKDREVSQKT